ncbi:hypothetical protein [Streptomyces sp. NRRL S-340]|uniref:hypothetical protein n=1 Tax=Streptomyces sp. NRRL S-340 TaxID=1463901 RepID=UPI000B1242E0|nr:hypothetical protein [Streptomyces sp. NRRL S-340]
MIAGDIVPPGCYLSAVEILRRQYTAHLLDRAARGELTTADGEPLMPLPRLSSALFGTTGWCQDLSDAALTHGARLVEEFLALFPQTPGGADDDRGCPGTPPPGSGPAAGAGAYGPQPGDRPVVGREP